MPPQMPVATFTEGKIKGSITDIKEQKSTALIVPGSMKSPNGITGQNFPTYNQVFGLFALLKTPIFDVSTFEPDSDPKFNPRIVLQLKDISYALNPALDFDLKKTKINGAVVIEISSKAFDKESIFNQVPMNYGNFELNHRYIDSESGYLISQFVSNFYNLEDIKNVIFQLNLMSVWDFNYYGLPNNQNIENAILKVDFKIAGDFYFNQKGSNDEQVNTFQVFTYNLYQFNETNNFSSTIQTDGGSNILTGNWATYEPGTIIIDDIVGPFDDIVWNVSGNNIYVKAEDVQVIGTVGPTEGYNLIIEAMNIDVNQDAIVLQNTVLKPNWFYDYPKSLPVMSKVDLPEGYCENSYKANTYANKNGSTNNVIIKEEIEAELINPDLKVFPNPASNEVNVVINNGDFESCIVELISVSGQVVFAQNVGDALANAFAIDVNSIPSGYYIVKITTNTGESFQNNVVVNR